jgi:hypothetical protein
VLVHTLDWARVAGAVGRSPAVHLTAMAADVRILEFWSADLFSSLACWILLLPRRLCLCMICKQYLVRGDNLYIRLWVVAIVMLTIATGHVGKAVGV